MYYSISKANVKHLKKQDGKEGNKDNTEQYCIIFGSTILYYLWKYNTVLSLEVQYCIIFGSTILYYLWKYNTVLSLEVQYCIIFGSMVLYYLYYLSHSTIDFKVKNVCLKKVFSLNFISYICLYSNS